MPGKGTQLAIDRDDELIGDVFVEVDELTGETDEDEAVARLTL